MPFTQPTKGRTEEEDHATHVNSMQNFTEMNNEALIQLAEDREEWRRFVVDRFDPQPAD